MSVPEQPLQLPAVWVGLDDLAIQTTNQFIGQISAPEEIFLGFGQAAPPPVFGTPEEQRAQLQAVSFIQVRAMARLGLTTHRLRELITVLQTLLNNHEQAFGRGTGL